MSTNKTVIETSFSKDSGYGNAVFSKVGAQNNAEYIGMLFGPKKDFAFVANRSMDTNTSGDYIKTESNTADPDNPLDTTSL